MSWQKITENKKLREIADNAMRRKMENVVTKMYRKCFNSELDDLELEHLPHIGHGMVELLKILREAGIDEFVVTDKSKNLLEKLYFLTHWDCRVLGMYERVIPEEDCIGGEKEDFVYGIRVQILPKEGTANGN